ncbi:MAG: type II toxin-antitoxin system RelE/ParE family toxin [Deltaproteobacteria bacterium]|nr:type II toxin-antitoxin system RelE/ParE family toxin [Deltaproteobacteria bacterium]
MKVFFKESFERDLKPIRDSKIKNQVKSLIVRTEVAKAVSDIPNIKKLAGGKNLYRIRLGDYRVGVIVEGQSITFVRIMHRKEIYRYFP